MEHAHSSLANAVHLRRSCKILDLERMPHRALVLHITAEAVNHFFAAWDIHIELSVLVRAVGRLPQVVQSDRARVARESLRKTLGCIFTTAALAKAAAVQAAPARAAIVPESTRLEEVLFHSHIEDTLHEHICDEYVAARSLHLGGMQFGDAIARPLTAANNPAERVAESLVRFAL